MISHSENLRWMDLEIYRSPKSLSIHSTQSCTECFGTNLSGTINKRTKFFSVCGNASNLSLKYRKLPAHISEDSPLNTNKKLDITGYVNFLKQQCEISALENEIVWKLNTSLFSHITLFHGYTEIIPYYYSGIVNFEKSFMKCTLYTFSHILSGNISQLMVFLHFSHSTSSSKLLFLLISKK